MRNPRPSLLLALSICSLVVLVKINRKLDWLKAVLIPWINNRNDKLGLPK